MIFAVLWPTVMVLGLRPLAGHYAYRHTDQPDSDEWWPAIWIALSLLLIWPVSLTWLIMGSLMSVGAERLARKQKRAEERKAAELRLKRRMAEMERQMLEAENGR